MTPAAILPYIPWLERPHTFIQIGANDGSLHDPIKNYIAAYGWRGIMVEPLPAYFGKLKTTYAKRKDLIFVQACIAETAGVRTLYYVTPETIATQKWPQWLNGIASFRLENLDNPITAAIPADIQAAVKAAITTVNVPTLPLSVLHGMFSEPVDVLQIDAQGYDCRILLSNDFKKFKPALIHFEMEKLTPVEDQKACTALLAAEGYALTRDGTNAVAALPSVVTATKPESYFSIGNTKIGYYVGAVTYNKPAANERRVELVLGERFVARYPDAVEIGAVLPYYYDYPHTVLDIGDVHPRNVMVDAAHIRKFTGKNVLSISTIEHIKPEAAAVLLERIRAEAAHYMITIPLGFQRLTEQYIAKTWPKDRYIILVRKTADNRWEEDPKKGFEHEYNKPFRYANALCILHSDPF